VPEPLENPFGPKVLPISFAKTPQQLNVLLATRYATSLDAFHFKRALNSGRHIQVCVCPHHFAVEVTNKVCIKAAVVSFSQIVFDSP
jgi:hypothetical protein